MLYTSSNLTFAYMSDVLGSSGPNVAIDKLRIVEEGNWWKFTANKEDPSMAEKLLATGDRELVEVSVLILRASCGVG